MNRSNVFYTRRRDFARVKHLRGQTLMDFSDAGSAQEASGSPARGRLSCTDSLELPRFSKDIGPGNHVWGRVACKSWLLFQANSRNQDPGCFSCDSHRKCVATMNSTRNQSCFSSPAYGRLQTPLNLLERHGRAGDSRLRNSVRVMTCDEVVLDPQQLLERADRCQHGPVI